jgi:cytosine/adenosine deaminase-related metal-dependent hydrolase
VSAVLIRDCEVVVMMDDAATEIPGGSILIRDGVVAWVGVGEPPPDGGTAESLRTGGAQVIDGRDTVATPGLINTHHHLFQAMTRGWAPRAGLFEWLTTLYPVWAGLDGEWARAGAMVGLVELARSGCSTCADHHYVFPRGTGDLLGVEVEAAAAIGVRLHANRGSMDVGRSGGGLPPDELVEDPDAVLLETAAAIERYHDPAPGALVRIAVGPCSPFTVSGRLMIGSAELARREGVRLHTHIAETSDEEAYCLERFGRRPVEYLDDLGFLGEDVWLAHCVHLSDADIARFAATRTGVAWCPTSNLRLGSGIAPARRLIDARVAVGLGVDGSASNDGGDLLAEARQGMLVSRADGDPAGMDPREALRVATRGGAAVLGRDDLGSLEPGKRGDVALFAVDGLEHAGADLDPVAAVLMCAPAGVRHLLVEGRAVVRDGRLVRADEIEIAAEGHRVARRILARSDARAGSVA